LAIAEGARTGYTYATPAARSQTHWGSGGEESTGQTPRGRRLSGKPARRRGRPKLWQTYSRCRTCTRLTAHLVQRVRGWSIGSHLRIQHRFWCLPSQVSGLADDFSHRRDAILTGPVRTSEVFAAKVWNCGFGRRMDATEDEQTETKSFP